MRNHLTTETISALSISFQRAVACGIYEKQWIARVYEPSKVIEAFHQALHWQNSLQNSYDPEHVEAGKEDRNLA
jgi:hypothetical protein